MTLATYITFFRLFLIPLFVGSLIYYSDTLITEGEFYRLVAAFFFVLAAFSDFLDGYLARKWNQETRLGSILDPIADKALNLSAFITLHTLHIPGMEDIPLWLVVLVISREISLVGGALAIHMGWGSLDIKAHWFGKLATCLQMILLAAILLKIHCLPLNALEWITGFFVLISLIRYLIEGISHIQRMDAK